MTEELWAWLVFLGLGLFVLGTYWHMLRRKEKELQAQHAQNQARLQALADGIIVGLREERERRARKRGYYDGNGIVLPAGPQGSDGIRERAVPTSEKNLDAS